MTDVSGWQSFTKAVPAKTTPKQRLTVATKTSSMAQAIVSAMKKNPEPTLPRVKEPTYVEQRCHSIDPNFKRTPFYRIRSPRGTHNRRPEGWTAISIILPMETVKALRQVAIALAENQQRSLWPRERRRYARTKSHIVGEALDDYFRKTGFPELCLHPEQHPPSEVNC